MADDEFSEFVLRTWPHLDRVALALTGSRHDADDLLQNTYTKAYTPQRVTREKRSYAMFEPQNQPSPNGEWHVDGTARE